MKDYFVLQLRLQSRRFSDYNLYPFLGYIFSVAVFLALSFGIFSLNYYSVYIYVFIAFIALMSLGEENRNDFLKNCFSKKQYHTLRILENSLIAFPFSCFLMYKNLVLAAILVFVASLVLKYLTFNGKKSFVLPTPFFKKPFEFMVGFRKTILVLLFAYFFAYKAIESGNFNVVILSYLTLLITCISYYNNTENELFVWIYHKTAKQFLWMKTGTAILHSSMLILPVFVSIGIRFPGEILIQLGFAAVIYIVLLTFILIKYTCFPDKTDVSVLKMVIVSFAFPPLLLGVIPFLYRDAINNLQKILE